MITPSLSVEGLLEILTGYKQETFDSFPFPGADYRIQDVCDHLTENLSSSVEPLIFKDPEHANSLTLETLASRGRSRIIPKGSSDAWLADRSIRGAVASCLRSLKAADPGDEWFKSRNLAIAKSVQDPATKTSKKDQILDTLYTLALGYEEFKKYHALPLSQAQCFSQVASGPPGGPAEEGLIPEEALKVTDADVIEHVKVHHAFVVSTRGLLEDLEQGHTTGYGSRTRQTASEFQAPKMMTLDEASSARAREESILLLKADHSEIEDRIVRYNRIISDEDKDNLSAFLNSKYEIGVDTSNVDAIRAINESYHRISVLQSNIAASQSWSKFRR